MILKRVNFESWTNLFSSKKIHFSLKIIRVYKVTLWSKIQFRQIMWLLYALNIWIKGKKIYTKTKQIHQRTDFNYSVLRCTSYSMGFWFNFVIYTIRMRFLSVMAPPAQSLFRFIEIKFIESSNRNWDTRIFF